MAVTLICAEADYVRRYLVELDGAASTMQATEESYSYLRRLTFWSSFENENGSNADS